MPGQASVERGAGKIIELGVWVAVEASQVTLSMKWELESPHPNLPQQKPGASVATPTCFWAQPWPNKGSRATSEASSRPWRG